MLLPLPPFTSFLPPSKVDASSFEGGFFLLKGGPLLLRRWIFQKCRGAAAAAAPKGAPRRRRRDLLRRVTLHLCSKAGALSYTIVQDGWSKLLVRFGFGVSGSAGQRSGRRRRPRSSPSRTSWRRPDPAFHYGGRLVAVVSFAGPIKGPCMPRDLAVDVILGTPNTGAVRLCRWPDYPEPIVGSHGRSRGQIWVQRRVLVSSARRADGPRARACHYGYA